MAVVMPFRAVRYTERAVPPLVAPPYDVISPEERARLRSSSPHNVVHLTLPDDEHDAARLLADWERDGIVEHEETSALWWLAQEFVGPDGVPRTREGLVGSVRLEPYSAGVILPHERTHAGPKEGRLRLLRATRMQLEPIFLLYEHPDELRPESTRSAEPTLSAELDGVKASLWRIEDPDEITHLTHALADRALLIADGHHRYETALAYHAEEGSPRSAFTFAVLVNTLGGGLTIFPTHRVFAARPDAFWQDLAPDGGDPQTALQRLGELPRDRPAVAVYEHGKAAIVTGPENGILDAQFVDRLGHEGISYTPRWQEAVAAVDSGRAAVAVLMRPPLIEQVQAVAEAGKTMPQKSTFFYPKLVSGLLFHPV